MTRAKQSQMKKKNTPIKKLSIFLTLVVMICCVFSPMRTAETQSSGSHLTIVGVTATPDPVTEMDTVRITVTIRNIGSTNISAGEHIVVSIKVDNEPAIIATLTDSSGLLRTKTRTENLTWVAALGSSQTRILQITITYLGVVESMTQKEIHVNERQTDLLFVSTPSIGGMSQIGKPITITAQIKNIGRNTTQDVNVSLNVDKALYSSYINSDDMVKGESFTVSFSWTPLTFGIHTINLTIDPKHTISEETKSNNYYETATSVIPWWNTSWHYRRIYSITGVGNISLQLNFTTLLKSLQLVDKTFENATIRIVRYYSNGTMALVNKTWFNESSTFNSRTNARGVLSFVVPGSSLYGVYFDVRENRGTRRPTTETYNLTQTGNIHNTIVTTQEGWWPEFHDPFETYYLVNTTVPVAVSTTALARNLTAYFFCNGALELTMPFATTDNLEWTNTTKKLAKRGNWAVQVIGYDDAGYKSTPLSTGFYVGQPDLTITALTVQKASYVGYNSTVIAHIRAFNTTVDHVNVTLRIDNLNTSTTKNLTIQKDENRTLQFVWLPGSKGSHTVSVVIDYPDSNPGNNSKSKTVYVEAVPDLGIVNISVTPVPVDEGDPVNVIVYINNTAAGNATSYKVVLYCEQNQVNNTMRFTDEKNSTTVDLNKNEYKKVTLVWDTTEYGKSTFNGVWAVGVQILNTTLTPDTYNGNNYKSLFHVLRVTPSERDPPRLTNLDYPSEIEVGNQVLIGVKATDASGIGTVVLSIKTPKLTFVNTTMAPTENNRYEYLYTPAQIGMYTFSIKATDLSPHKNQSTITGSFEVTGDKTPPTITYYGVNPLVQLQNDPVEIRCITTDASGVRSVETMILFPDNLTETYTMRYTPSDTKYTYTHSYSILGEYTFWVTVEDTKGNTKTSEGKTFWVTDDLNDTDSDGMPDTWERQYRLNPYDPSDVSGDLDNDRMSNLEEYTAGTNPMKKTSSPSELIDRLGANWAYLAGSLTVCLIIVLLAYYGITRRNI